VREREREREREKEREREREREGERERERERALMHNTHRAVALGCARWQEGTGDVVTDPRVAAGSS
jgi:hypothetical protein